MKPAPLNVRRLDHRLRGECISVGRFSSSCTCFGFGLYSDPYRVCDPKSLAPCRTVCSVSLIYWWYHDDKRDRAFLAGRWMNIGMIALAIVTVTIYLFRSRGAKDGAIASVLFVITFFGAVASRDAQWLDNMFIENSTRRLTQHCRRPERNTTGGAVERWTKHVAT